MTWLLTILSLMGNYLNCRKVRLCFIIWFIVNTGWLIFDLINNTYSRALLDTVQNAFCIYGYQQWGEKT